MYIDKGFMIATQQDVGYTSVIKMILAQAVKNF